MRVFHLARLGDERAVSHALGRVIGFLLPSQEAPLAESIRTALDLA